MRIMYRVAQGNSTAVLLFALVCMALCSCGGQHSSKAPQPSEAPQREQETTEKNAVAVEASIQVLGPNGGEVITAGVPFQVTWRSQGLDGAHLQIKIHGGDDGNRGGWYPVAANIENTGSHECVTGLNWGWEKYKVHISTMNGETSDASDDYFSIRGTQPAPSAAPPHPRRKRGGGRCGSVRKAGAFVRIDDATGKAIDVTLRDMDVNDETMAGIEKLSSLKGLDLADCRLGNASLGRLRNSTKLLGLRLTGTDVTDEDLNFLEGLKNLIALDFQNTAVTREALQELSQAVASVHDCRRRFPPTGQAIDYRKRQDQEGEDLCTASSRCVVRSEAHRAEILSNGRSSGVW